jgi:hypothetical protein
MRLNESELRSAVDGDEQIQPTLFGADFSDIDVEVADRAGLELLTGRPVALNIGQPGALGLQIAFQAERYAGREAR